MEENDQHGSVLRQISVRTNGSSKSTLSGRSGGRSSPSFRRLNSSRTPRKESKGILGRFQWVRSNRVVFWLILIALWAYIGFHVQSNWAHNDNTEAKFVSYTEIGSAKLHEDIRRAAAPIITNTTTTSGEESAVVKEKNDTDLLEMGVSLVSKERPVPSQKKAPKKRIRRPRKRVVIPKDNVEKIGIGQMEDGMIPRRNTSYGLIMGPFANTEGAILGWSPDKRKGTCDRNRDFARIVWSRSFVLIFHELSMTGAPLSMLELATEILSCGGTVSAVVLSRKGGLMAELGKRGIKVLNDRVDASFKSAMKADLVIAGSAVCSSWIEPYLLHFPAASNKIVWWIMENRREYFDRSLHLLNHVKILIFLSDSQSKQWLSWCEEEHIRLSSPPMVVPLSVNDELAFVAGIPCSLNTPDFSVEKMLQKRNLLRNAVRKEMGLSDNDMLLMSLSSINAGKGQYLLLESALSVLEHNVSLKDFKPNDSFEEKELPQVASVNQSAIASKPNPQTSSHKMELTDEPGKNVLQTNNTGGASRNRRKGSRLSYIFSLRNQTSKDTAKSTHRKSRYLLAEREDGQEQNLKVLIGSLGSKSNKVLYIKAILGLISQHLNLSKIVLWTPTTTHVAPLYAAADVYIINAQGVGETFGRVTIEAMAFGLPVIGTDAGGTKEIVENKVTGLLHPIGREGKQTLAENIQFLLSNPSVRKKMGMIGRQRVQEKYLKNSTYNKFAEVLAKCMKI
ncbi:uncharacterized protein [Typha latifolia]|uniref:uncharacterized protein n=1 Tax=Typha latifolia TaxID=4733 RepID=UPI003C2BBBBE